MNELGDAGIEDDDTDGVKTGEVLQL